MEIHIKLLRRVWEIKGASREALIETKRNDWWDIKGTSAGNSSEDRCDNNI